MTINLHLCQFPCKTIYCSLRILFASLIILKSIPLLAASTTRDDQEFSSHYINIQDECKANMHDNRLTDDLLILCPEFKGFQALVRVEATKNCLSIKQLGSSKNTDEVVLSDIACDRRLTLPQSQLEWRLAPDGKIFALILHLSGGEQTTNNVGNFLIQGLPGYEFVNASVDATTNPNAHEGFI